MPTASGAPDGPSGAPAAVTELVSRFHEQRDAYHAGRYNETQIRREFIDPFFQALGWDVGNERGYAEAYSLGSPSDEGRRVVEEATR